MTALDIFERIQHQVPKHPKLLNLFFRDILSSEASFNQCIEHLKNSESSKLRLKNYIDRVFYHKDITYTLVESGISNRTGFASEIIRKLKHTILPEEKDKVAFHQTLLTVFEHGKLLKPSVLYKLEVLFEELEISLDFKGDFLQKELLHAVEVLSYRITATAIESEFIQKFKRNETLHSFVQQNKVVQQLMNNHQPNTLPNNELITQLIVVLDEATTDIQKLKSTANHQGASLQLTYSLNRVAQQITRLKALVMIYVNPVVTPQRLAELVFVVLQNETKKNSVRKQLNETTYLLAYQITEHESKTGEHYIAETKEDYKEMFVSSSKGGVFASLMTLIKIVLHHIPFAPFWQAFAYSVNYATGFVAIQITHSTLATKQPAMTAARIAHSLDTQKNDDQSIQALALTIGKVSRSQFVSFAGNLLVVFPLSFFIAFCYQLIFNDPIVNTKQAYDMLHEVHPYLNPTWFYACITGVFLFTSGIISGYYDNKVIYSNIPFRIRHHKGLQKVLSKRWLIRFSKYVEHNLGSLIGNICLGFFLGMAAFIGFIFGLPFDIRHITISSGNYAIAMFTLMGNVSWQYALVCLVGVLGIGMFNFLVSFGLAIFIAARSRKVKFHQFADLLKWTWVYVKKYPKDFFFAPKKDRNISDLTVAKK
jgi:site-specific recombinase